MIWVVAIGFSVVAVLLIFIAAMLASISSSVDQVAARLINRP